MGSCYSSQKYIEDYLKNLNLNWNIKKIENFDTKPYESSVVPYHDIIFYKGEMSINSLGIPSTALFYCFLNSNSEVKSNGFSFCTGVTVEHTPEFLEFCEKIKKGELTFDHNIWSYSHGFVGGRKYLVQL